MKEDVLPFGYLYSKQLIAMLSGISWYGYLSFLVVVVSAYYLAVFAIFYRKEIIFWVNKFKAADTIPDSFLYDPLSQTVIAGENASTENLQKDISQILSEGVSRKLGEQEIIMTFELLLSDYKDRIPPLQREKINQYIIRECKNICSIHLNEEKAVSLWLSER